jgi:hypothetical protein
MKSRKRETPWDKPMASPIRRRLLDISSEHELSTGQARGIQDSRNMLASSPPKVIQRRTNSELVEMAGARPTLYFGTARVL